MKKFICILFAFIILAIACNPTVKNNKQASVPFNDKIDYSILMGETLLKNYPDLWKIEDRKEPKWSYTYGLVCLSMLKLWEETGNEMYYNYAKAYADALIDENGNIRTYVREDYNIDKINSGNILFTLYNKTGDNRYKIAMNSLRSQLKEHPQTEMGGFWHKQRYPHQMWLDGVYMGAPFYTQYAQVNNETESFNEIASWIKNVAQVTHDEKTGLLYHAWDESKDQAWSDKETGCSPNFWGRAMGWYVMALVDVLDYFPKDHSDYNEIVNITKNLAAAIIKYQDAETGTWYQVLDQGKREGNYLEGSASAMFSYFLLKAINKGYIDKETYLSAAIKAYQGMVATLVKVASDSTLIISPVCAVAGLGGNPYRDGSYEYYVNEQLRDNDPKAVGPFIMAGIEYKRLAK
ncbi:MAG: glycoside hydrolase family 88 protein [Salinivirgaceae bacterium]|jgi:unsaturated rhamnogalacturonyl hydrolase|nr:glycoside hydrolase family 88 protein [Salinivirgaceae bacterium]